MLLDRLPVVLVHVNAVGANLCRDAVFVSLPLPLPHASFQPLNCTQSYRLLTCKDEKMRLGG